MVVAPPLSIPLFLPPPFSLSHLLSFPVLCEPAARLPVCLFCSVVISDNCIFIFCRAKSTRENCSELPDGKGADWLSQEPVTSALTRGELLAK